MIDKDEVLEKINVSLPNYVSEKIRYASDSKFETKSDILLKIKKMRKIASQAYFNTSFGSIDYHDVRNWVFLQQAKYMSDVEDDYQCQIQPDFYYIWSYEYLEIPELRTYFTWRSKIRKKEHPKIYSAYIILYLNELINLVGVKDEVEAWEKIKDIIKQYKDELVETYIKKVISSIVKDFVINYNIPVSYQEVILITSNEEELEKYEMLIKLYKKDYSNLLPFLNEMSSYKIVNSNFYPTKYGFLIEKALPTVFSKLEEYFTENKLDFFTLVFGQKKLVKDYILFKQTTYYEQRKNYKCDVLFSEIEKYHLENKKVTVKMFNISPNIRAILGIILKLVEARIREKTNYKRKITVNVHNVDKIPVRKVNLIKVVLDPRFTETVNNAVDEFLKKHQKDIQQEMLEQRKKEIKIDSKQFEEIRKSSNRIQEKLVIEEDLLEEIEVVNIEEIKQSITEVEMGISSFIKSLTPLEKEIVIDITNQISRNELELKVKTHMSLLEVVLEDINLKALDYIGDNLIQDLINEVIIYEEYSDEVKETLQNIKGAK